MMGKEMLFLKWQRQMEGIRIWTFRMALSSDPQAKRDVEGT